MREETVDHEFVLYDNKFNLHLCVKIQDDCWSHSCDFNSKVIVTSLTSVKYYFEQNFSAHGGSYSQLVDKVITAVVDGVKAELSPIKAEVEEELTKQEWRNYFTARWQAGEH